jgi:hypothetical protein
MPSFQGQSDQVLKIQLTSVMARVGWLEDKVAAGGFATLECMTAYVGNGAAIKVVVKDEGGATVVSSEGTVHANVHRNCIALPKDCKAKGIIAEVELPKHGIKGVSGSLKVVPAIAFSDLKWLDAEGATLTALANGVTATCEAKVTGLEADDKAQFSVYQTRGEHGRALLCQGETPVLQGKASFTWRHEETPGLEKIRRQPDLDKEGGHYHAPEYVFTVAALGALAESEPLKHETWIEYEFGPAAGGAARTAILEMPDGEKREEAVPDDGLLRLKQVKPGTVIFKGFKDG